MCVGVSAAGVMSGEEAEKVLTQHSVHFTSDPPSVNLKTPPKKRPAPQQTTPPSQEIPASHKKPRKEEDLDEAGEQLRLKGLTEGQLLTCLMLLVTSLWSVGVCIVLVGGQRSDLPAAVKH